MGGVNDTWSWHGLRILVDLRDWGEPDLDFEGKGAGRGLIGARECWERYG